MKDSNRKKDEQLEMPHGTAQHRLRKSLLFKYITICGESSCFRCDEVISNIDNFSIDHKTAWLDSEDPIGLFFSLDNVAFSHIDCNNKSKRPPKRVRNHGITLYQHGCRCSICYNAQVIRNRAYRSKLGV